MSTGRYKQYVLSSTRSLLLSPGHTYFGLCFSPEDFFLTLIAWVTVLAVLALVQVDLADLPAAAPLGLLACLPLATVRVLVAAASLRLSSQGRGRRRKRGRDTHDSNNKSQEVEGGGNGGATKEAAAEISRVGKLRDGLS